MCVCVYTRVCVCVYVWIRIFAYTCTYLYVCINVYIYTHIYICTCISVYVYIFRDGLQPHPGIYQMPHRTGHTAAFGGQAVLQQSRVRRGVRAGFDPLVLRAAGQAGAVHHQLGRQGWWATPTREWPSMAVIEYCLHHILNNTHTLSLLLFLLLPLILGINN